MLAFVSAILVATILAVIPPTKGEEFQVVVGGTGVLEFNPNQVVSPFHLCGMSAISPDPRINLMHQTANVGDIVTFIFEQKNHTATQSTLAEPCSPKEGGFDSGL